MDCTWNAPGADPYQGTVAAAVARYEYPPRVREALAARAARFDFDFLLVITRDRAEGAGTSWQLADMHYSRSRVCRGGVVRDKWPADQLERAMVYCEGTYCIAIPFVCRNVSRLLPVVPSVLPLPLRPPLVEDTFPARPGDAPAPVPPAGPASAPVPRVVNTVPEPGSLPLVLMAGAVLAWWQRKRARVVR